MLFRRGVCQALYSITFPHLFIDLFTYFGPEEADVRNVEEHHRQPLQTKPKRPPVLRLVNIYIYIYIYTHTHTHTHTRTHYLGGHAAAIKDRLLDDAATQHLQPLVVVENLQLEGGLWEEVCVCVCVCVCVL